MLSQIVDTPEAMSASMIGEKGETAGTSMMAFRRYDPYERFRKFSFYGLVELQYYNTTYDTSSRHYSAQAESSAFQQLYQLGLKGYIYHPRLALFNARVTYGLSKSDYSGSSAKSTTDNVRYETSITFLPARPLSLRVMASRGYIETKGNESIESNITSNYYSATLSYMKKNRPHIRLGYTHWDTTRERMQGRLIRGEDLFYYYDFWEDEGDEEEKPFLIERERRKEKTSIDLYSLNIRGDIKLLRTKYNLVFAFSQNSTMLRDFAGKYANSTMITNLGKKVVLSTYFRYSDIEVSKLLTLSTRLNLPPIERLYHEYGYEYSVSESEREDTRSHALSSIWRYQYSTRVHGRLHAKYWFTDKTQTGENIEENSYDINAGVYYGKPFQGFDVSSSYNFNIGTKEKSGKLDYLYNTLSLKVTTLKLTNVKIYASYDGSLRTIEYTPLDGNRSPTDSRDIENVLTVGATGKGPYRLSWTLEAKGRFLNSTSTEGEVWRSVWSGDNPYAEKIRHYTLEGQLRFPLGRKGTVSARGYYTIGTTNSEPVRRYVYEGRLQYRIMKSMSLTAWYREEWRNEAWWTGTLNVSRQKEWKIRDYTATLNYRWRSLLFSVEYTVTHTEEDFTQWEVRRLFVKAARHF